MEPNDTPLDFRQGETSDIPGLPLGRVGRAEGTGVDTCVCVQVTHKRYMPFRLLPNWPVQPMWLDITGRGSTIQRRIFKDCMCVVIIDPNTSDMIRFQVSVLGTISTYFSPVWTSDNIWLKIFLYSQYDSYYSWKVCIPNMKVNIPEREQYTVTE